MKRITLLSGILFLAIACPTEAQYPTVPDSIQQRVAQENAYYDKLDNTAWEKALKIVKKEEKKYGRVYRPWASKPEDLPQCQIPAFPGAEGGGAFTAGGRGGKVITVTSLADRGPGTLREACETGGARIVVFNVAGVIELKSPISIKAPYITIAGQTAPGDGVCVAGASFLIDTHDVIIRHMRFRRGAQYHHRPCIDLLGARRSHVDIPSCMEPRRNRERDEIAYREHYHSKFDVCRGARHL